MPNRNIKLVLSAFLYSLLLLSHHLYAMDPPSVLGESSQDELDSNKNSEPVDQLLLENEFLSPSEAQLVRDILNSPEYKKVEGVLGHDLYNHKDMVPDVVFIGCHLPGGMEELLIALVGVARFKSLVPTIEKVIAHFVPQNFPNGKRSQLADKLLHFLDRLCREHRKSGIPREKFLLKKYDPFAITENITMKAQALLHEVTDEAMSRWMKGERRDNAVSNYNKFTDGIRDFFMLEFLQMQEESERIHFMDILFEVIRNFLLLNNLDAASSTITAFQNITRLAGTPTDHLEKVNGFYRNNIMQPNPTCLNSLPRFSVITNKYDLAYGLIKESSPHAFFELCNASRHLSDMKKKCAYSFRVDPSFKHFLDTIDVTENLIDHLYGCIFNDNHEFFVSEKEYSKWSIADLVSFFNSHDRMDLLRGLLRCKIIDGATLHQRLLGDNDESRNLRHLLEPLSRQLLAGELGSIKEAHIDTSENTPPTSPAKMNSLKKSNSKARVRSQQIRSPNSLLSATDEPSRNFPNRKKSSIFQKRRSQSSSSSSGSRRTISESSEADTKSESPKKDSPEGLMIITKEPGMVARKLSFPDLGKEEPCVKVGELDLGNLEQVKLELQMNPATQKKSQDP